MEQLDLHCTSLDRAPANSPSATTSEVHADRIRSLKTDATLREDAWPVDERPIQTPWTIPLLTGCF